MSPARVMPSQRTELANLREHLGLSDLDVQARGITAVVCRDILEAIGAEVAQATAQHFQSASRRELLNQAVHTAVQEFHHLADPVQPAPRLTSRLFRRLGRAEADAGWEIDVVLIALECLHASWARAVATWSTTSGTSFAPVSQAFTEYLLRLHRHAAHGQTTALSQAPAAHSPLGGPRPELAMMELVDQWRDTVPSFDVGVRAQRARAAHGRLGAHDHQVSVAPHPSLPGIRHPEGITVGCASVPAARVLGAYRDCLLGLRLIDRGVFAPIDLHLPGPEISRVPLHPSQKAVTGAAAQLSGVLSLEGAERVAAAHALLEFLHDPHAGIHVPACRPSGSSFKGPQTPPPLDDLLPEDPSLAGHRLSTLAVLRLALPTWMDTATHTSP